MFTLVNGAGITGSTPVCDLQTAVVSEARGQNGSRLISNHDFAGIPVEFGAGFTEGELAPT